MNERVGSPRIGQWYLRGDKGESFLVTGRDAKARTIEIQTFGGDVDEIDENNWSALPLEFAEPPEDTTGPLDSQPDQLAGDEPARPATETLETVEPAPPDQEPWEDSTAEDERDPLGEGTAAEEALADHPEARRGID